MNIRISPKQFAALPRAKKAVLLAKDVIGQIAAQGYEVRPGGYVRIFGIDVPDACELTPKRIADANCTVCAKGALYLSRHRLANNAKGGDIYYDPDTQGFAQLVEIFGSKQFDLIELAFKGWPKPGKSQGSARIFGLAHNNPGRRAVAIMLNVIQNRGQFIPSKRITDKQVTAALKRPAAIIPTRPKIKP